MVDTVTATTLEQTESYLVRHYTNESDGTGETNVVKLSKSAVMINGVEVTSVAVASIEYVVSGMNYVVLAHDATANDTIALLSGSGFIDFEPYGSKKDPISAGNTGDILLSTNGAVVGGMYDIIVRYHKVA